MPSTINLDNGAQVANISLDSAGNLDFNFNNSNDTRVSINDDNGIVTIGGGQGGVGRNGGLQIRNSVGAFTIFLGDDGGTSNILIGGATNSAIRMGNAQGLTTIAMEGATGSMNLGAGPQGSVPGQDGNLVLLDGRGGASIVLAGSNGNVRCVSLTETSDSRLKKGIVPLLNALDKVLAMRGVRYQSKQQESRKEAFSEESQIGFIGQEVEGVCPEIVSTDLEGYKSVRYTRLTPILVEAIKEQQKVIQRQAVALGEALEKIARIETIMRIGDGTEQVFPLPPTLT